MTHADHFHNTRSPWTVIVHPNGDGFKILECDHTNEAEVKANIALIEEGPYVLTLLGNIEALFSRIIEHGNLTDKVLLNDIRDMKQAIDVNVAVIERSARKN